MAKNDSRFYIGCRVKGGAEPPDMEGLHKSEKKRALK
jgi:hypothetical protein